MNIVSILEQVAGRNPRHEIEIVPRCYEHYQDMPCSQCAENERRGYAVMQLAGRCANGFEGGHGVKWHAVRKGEYKAVCGATYGRRSAGWSSWQVIGQEVTCPKCQKKLTTKASKEG